MKRVAAQGVRLAGVLAVFVPFTLSMLAITLLGAPRASVVGLQVVLSVLAFLEARNGVLLLFQTRRTVVGASYSYDEGSQGPHQEFGLYSLAIAGAYLLGAVWEPYRPLAVCLALGLSALTSLMHLSRAAGRSFVGTPLFRPRRTELYEGIHHLAGGLVILALIPRGMLGLSGAATS